MTPTECDFCFEIQGGEPRLLGLPRSTVGRRVYESSGCGISLLADASPVLPGHSLFVPSSRHVSRFTLSDPKALSAALDDFANRVSAQSNVVFFEHGGFSCLRHGLCSEHAHLHAVPVPAISMRDLLPVVRRKGGRWSNRYDSIRTLYENELGPKAVDYLVLGVASADGIDVRRILFDSVESQILRVVLADCAGVEAHIRSLELRQAEVRFTCEMIGRCYPIAAPDFTEQGSVTALRKKECINCAYECVRSVKTKTVAVSI